MSSSQDADVIVAGAGPAGATAARRLASAGRRVLLLERAGLPRQKPCGGGISARVVPRFPWLAAALARIETHAVSRLYLEGPAGRVFRMESSEPAVLLIRRIEFDHALAQLAIGAGAELVRAEITQASQDDAGVTLRTRDGATFRAPLVIAADGVNSVIARRLGLNRGWPPDHVALDMMEEAPNAALRATEPGTLSVFYGFGGAHGYAYIFPKRSHVNVGIGYLLSYFRERVDTAPYDLQKTFVASLRGRGMLEGESHRERFTPFLIPVGGPLRTTAAGRVLLAGDAGGFVNGFSAEGIYYAMVTGELAASAVVAARRGDGIDAAAARRGYVRAWKREIGGELRDSVLVQRYLFHSPSRMDQVIDGANLRPEFSRWLVDYASGRLPYAVARRRLLLRFPALLPRLAWLAWAGRPRAAAAGGVS
jgi:geranylgeranyl reductase family protein